MKTDWIYCPICGRKTRNQTREDTILANCPLYCPKCKQVLLIEANNFHIKILLESVAKTQSQ